MTLGENIIRIRKEKGITQSELAEKVGVLSQTMYKYERGIVTNIPLSTVEKIASALDVVPGDLVGWDTSKLYVHPDFEFCSDSLAELTEDEITQLRKVMEAMFPRLNGADDVPEK